MEQKIFPINRQASLEIGPTTGKPSALTVQDTHVVIAKERGKLLKDHTRPELVVLAAQIMDKSKIRLAHVKDANYSEDMIEAMVQDFSRFPGLTDMEIKAAAAMGCNGDFYKGKDQPVIYFSPSNVVQWVKDYIETVKAPTMKKVAIEQAKQEESPVPTLAEQNAMLIKGLLEHFEKMKANPDYVVVDYGNAYYDFLNEIGIPMASLEEKKAMHAEETQREKAAQISNIHEAREKRKWLDMLEENQARSKDDPHEFRIISRCKKRTLIKYLKELIEFEIDLGELLKDKI